MRQFVKYDETIKDEINIPLLEILNKHIAENMDVFLKPQRSILILGQIYSELYLAYLLKKYRPDIKEIDEKIFKDVIDELLEKSDSFEIKTNYF